MDRDAAAIAIVRRSEADAQLERVYRHVAGERGEAANILAVSSLHPRAMEDHARFYRGLQLGPSPLSRTERELVATVVSSVNDCHY